MYRQWFDAALNSSGAKPRESVLALFDALLAQVRPEVCRGCPFQMALAEFSDPDHPAHQLAVANKVWVRGRFGDLAGALARDKPGTEPETVADGLYLLFEGSYASIQSLGFEGPAGGARLQAERMISPTSR